MIVRRSLFVCALVILTVGTCYGKDIHAPKPVTYTPYINFRFGFQCDIPDKLLIAGQEPENGDGLKFKSKNGLISVTMFGQNNALFLTVPQMMQQEIQYTGNHSVITYRRLAKDWFAFSGRDGNKIFYKKVIYHDEQYYFLDISYDQRYALWFNPMVTHMSRSFHYEPVKTHTRNPAGTVPISDIPKDF